MDGIAADWWHLASVSGGILYLMPLLLLVVLFVTLERSWVLGVLRRRGTRLLSGINLSKDIQSLHAEVARAPASPHRAVLTAVLDAHTLDDGSAYAEEVLLHQAPALDRDLWMLDTTITLAPLLGLLGTIVGMFHAFQLLGGHDVASQLITGHIAEALVATAAGLGIAIIGLVFYNALNQRVRLLLHQLETVKVAALNRRFRPESANQAGQASTMTMPIKRTGG
jgi:biopolymer transport protein ExbB